MMKDEKDPKNAFQELFEYRKVARFRLVLSLSITALVMFLEIIGGILTNSISLLSDAGHMFTHTLAISISLAAIIIARKPPCHHRTYGLYRAEVLAALINGIFLLVVVAFIIYQAILRILNPKEINAIQMLLVALIGLAVNLASIFILHSGYKTSLNIRSVFYHLLGDTASSVGIVIASIIIFYKGWNIIDPIVSLAISALIIYWAAGILRDSSRILLEVAPRNLNISIIENDLINEFPEIHSIGRSHLWTITSDMLVFSTHIKLNNSNKNNKDLPIKINKFLRKKYGIIESTIQINYLQ